MLKRFIAIKNVGRFQNSAAGGDTQLRKFSFIQGANGHGKTTICTILRSLKTGNQDYVLGRATLGAKERPEVQLLTDKGAIRFDASGWSHTCTTVTVFDSLFVSENVHAGDVVDIEQKRGLYRVIIGEAGVALAEEEASLAAESRTKTSEITALEKTIKTHLPVGMKLEAFLAVAQVASVDQELAAQEAKLRTVSEAATITSKALLPRVVLPTLPESLDGLLAATIDDVADHAENSVAAHLQVHHMVPTGRAWITQGLDFAAETCPFCGQDIQDVSLVSAYRAVFGESYKQLKTRISALRSQVGADFGDAASSRLELMSEQYRSGLVFWRQYATLDGPDFPEEALVALRDVYAELTSLLDRKAAAPLEQLNIEASAQRVIDSYKQAQRTVDVFNVSVVQMNSIIAAKKAEAGDGNVSVVKVKIESLKAVKIRHSPAVAQICRDRSQAVKDKGNIDAQKATVREKLDKYTANVVKPYQERINELLDDFNAGFTIAQTQHSYMGGTATSSYQLVINSKAVDVGASTTPNSIPSFRNTLSAGDRSTLALAFFIAHLEREAKLAETVVVFDDPFNSQDAFRRKQTVHEILKIGRKCAQVIVLSHDATFLKEVWVKCDAADRASLGLVDHGQQGSKIMALDLEKACQGRTATDVDDLLAYHRDRVGKPIDIVRKMRTVLETYLRTHYPACFLDKEWLGDMIKKIREGGSTHPAYPLCDKLDQINGSAQYHHGENLSDITPDQIDPQELAGLVRRTLRIVNALQA